MSRSKIPGQPPIFCKRTRENGCNVSSLRIKPRKSSFLGLADIYAGHRSSGKAVVFSTTPFKSRAH